MAISNPLAFTRGPVTIITTIVYVAIVVVLLVVQTSVPSPPRSSTPIKGINLTEAWLDLQLLSRAYHPYNSRRNDEVRSWLLTRVESILTENGVSVNTSKANVAPVFVFNDTSCNLTSSVAYGALRPGSGSGVSAYFESTNILVYIQGEEDDKTEWWTKEEGTPTKRNGVLVNAHYDSVSTGFGATDDGMGVISVLQLLKYYTTPGNRPKTGLVLLLNNGEEDFLNGARAFSQHPMSKLINTFLNLEGAGAGGRAVLFRSTDTEVTRAYAGSKYPFGSVLIRDGFERGLVKSQTDYVVFYHALGYRGLDVAFFEPRARYHTASDDTRHTTKGSVWHMLSASISTTQKLTASPLSTEEESPGVWFDLFGRFFAVFQLHTLFALSVTLLVVSPIILMSTLVILYSTDKLYLYSNSGSHHTTDADEPVPLYGWRGFFRSPLILLFASAAPVALAYLLFKENTFIAHSSEWAVWSMMVSSFFYVAWFLCRVAEYARPSSLTRAYSLGWLFMGWWVFLVFATIGQTRHNMGGSYFVVFYFASIFLATWLSYLELFSLPKKSKYCSGKDEQEVERPSSRHTGDYPADEEEQATETSGLLRKGRSPFKKYHSQPEDSGRITSPKDDTNELEEQEWSKSQWSWLWLLQLLILVPVNLVLVGQIGLFIVASLHQTGSDGSDLFLVYIVMAIFTILLLSPIVPFLHRFTWHVPTFLLLVLIGTLIYNLVAFPFSSNNRLKLSFQQEVDLDAGTNRVYLTGIPDFVQDAITSLPSAAGQSLLCWRSETNYLVAKCSWAGLPPKVVDPHSTLSPKKQYRTWLSYNVSRTTFEPDSKTSKSATSARFIISGRNTRNCKIVFDTPITDLHVHGSSPADKRFTPVPDGGSNEVRLWSRTWDRTWTVDVVWGSRDNDDTKNKTGKVVCMWADVNELGVIPAFDEARHFAPEWAAITKASDGLVEGFKRFTV